MKTRTTEEIRYEFTKLQYTPKDKWIKLSELKKWCKDNKFVIYHKKFNITVNVIDVEELFEEIE